MFHGVRSINQNCLVAGLSLEFPAVDGLGISSDSKIDWVVDGLPTGVGTGAGVGDTG
jgi:hypothetical protein